jgi:hypothetical protein
VRSNALSYSTTFELGRPTDPRHGVIAIPNGPFPTLMAGPALLGDCNFNGVTPETEGDTR